jgi:rRNA maturation RNase YbeY
MQRAAGCAARPLVRLRAARALSAAPVLATVPGAAACGAAPRVPPPLRPLSPAQRALRAFPPGVLRGRLLVTAAGKGKDKEKSKDKDKASKKSGKGGKGSKNALPAPARPPPGVVPSDGDPDEGFSLDVDVLVVDGTPGGDALAALAAELEASAERLLRAVLDAPPPPAGAPPTPTALAALRKRATGAELSVALCSDEYIRKLNAEWRAKDAPTDVLSFAQLEGEDEAGFLIMQGHALLGDVIISVETAAAQAKERGHSLRDELQTLLVHGLLHLVGYDHERGEADAAAMAAEEARVLAAMAWGGTGLISAVQQQGDGGDDGSPGAQGVAAQRRASSGVAKPVRQSEIDVLLLDMDGTLLNRQHLVTPATVEALHAVRARGVQVIVATGKARPGAIAALSASGLSAPGGVCGLDTPGVFLQGLCVYGTAGTMVFRRELSPDVVSEAFALSASSGVPAAAFCGDTCSSLEASAHLDLLHTRYYEPRAQVAGSLGALLAGPPVSKMLFYATSAAAIAELRPRVEAALAGRATVVQAVPDMLEVLPLAASKGAGVAKLLHALGVPPERAAAVGDGENDVDMLR